MGSSRHRVRASDASSNSSAIPWRPIRLFAIAIFLAFCAWTAWSLISLYSSSRSTMAHANLAKAAVATGDLSRTKAEVANAISRSGEAEETAHSAPLSWIGVLPGIGRPVDMLQGMTSVARDTLAEVVEPLASINVVGAFTNTFGAPGVNVGEIRSAIPTIQNTSKAATSLAERADAIPDMSFLPVLGDARDELVTASNDLASALGTLSSVAPSLPGLLGGDGERTYLMVFQTNAESRGTGGLLGGTAILHANNGVITIDRAAPNYDLRSVPTPTDLGPDFEAMYGKWNPDADAKNANFSPHYPYAGTLWKSIWEQNNGTKLDGVIATDPVALSYLLGATGPIVVAGGERIDATNVAAVTLNELYFRYPNPEDQVIRKEYLQIISRTVIESITSSRASKPAVLKALGKAAGEQRLMMWSTNPAEQAALETTPLGHIVPDDETPYANVVVNNGAGGKLDYYLDREISYKAGDCTAETRSSTITVKLINTAPKQGQYPPYLFGRLSPETQYGGPPGTNRTVVSMFTTKGAKFDSISINGVPSFAQRNNERGHPVFSTVVTTKPGATTEIVLTLTEPTATGAARVPVQPLARDAKVDVAVPEC